MEKVTGEEQIKDNDRTLVGIEDYMPEPPLNRGTGLDIGKLIR